MLMANMAHVRRASLVCDPFVGSGQYTAFMHIHVGTLKMRDWKMRDWKYRHQTAGVENAGLELSAPYSRGWKMRDWKILEQEMYGTQRVA